ncbi:MAG: DUF1326 domain-containing protein [Betaproteobacteria bacterium]
MADVPQWHAKGDWFDVCKCSIPCPCTFAQPPTDNTCEGILAWHIGDGRYGSVDLSGLSVVALGAFTGNLWAGAKAQMAFYVDARADAAQRQALEAIWGGRAGGWMADLSGWRIETPGVLLGEAKALTGPTTPPGARVQVHHAPGAEVGPGQVTTWGVAPTDRADGFGFKWDRSGRSSKHFPFDWRGPA